MQLLDGSLMKLQAQGHRRASSQDPAGADSLFRKVPCVVDGTLPMHMSSSVGCVKPASCQHMHGGWSQAATMREERRRLAEQAEQLEQYERCGVTDAACTHTHTRARMW